MLGGLANQGLSWLFGQFGNWLYNWVFDGIANLMDTILEFTNGATNIFWEVDAVSVILDFSAWVNVVVLVISLFFLMMDVVEQSGRVNWSILFSNLCKGMAFVLFNRYIGQATLQLAIQCADALNIQVDPPAAGIIKSMLGIERSGIFVILVVLVILVAFIAFFFISLLRNGAMFVQILSSSFYIPSIIRGDTAQLGEWLRQTVTIAATYFLQYLLFYLGLGELDAGIGSVTAMSKVFVITGTCWLTMFMVPRILERFGYTSGAREVFSAAGSMASSGLSIAKMM